MVCKKLIKDICVECRFEDGIGQSKITEAEKALKVSFPHELKECLLECNGVYGEYDSGLVWPLDRIITTNQEFRKNSNFLELYMPFDSMLFFADAGNGDQFFFPIQNEKVRREDIFLWSHEDDSRNWVAPGVDIYIDWRINGKINA